MKPSFMSHTRAHMRNTHNLMRLRQTHAPHRTPTERILMIVIKQFMCLSRRSHQPYVTRFCARTLRHTRTQTHIYRYKYLFVCTHNNNGIIRHYTAMLNVPPDTGATRRTGAVRPHAENNTDQSDREENSITTRTKKKNNENTSTCVPEL